MSNKLFKVILLLKIVLLILFSSDYNSLLFQPFVNTFIEEGLKNPWQFYLEQNKNLDAFPYHSLMLLILTPFAFLSKLLHLGFIFKIPLLIADIGIYRVLTKLFPHKQKNIILFYFLNPIIIYAIFIHSQLDIIPTAILIASIYYLKKNKYLTSAIMLGMALATKIHIIVALPLFFFFLYKLKGIKQAALFVTISVATLFILDLPFLFSEGFNQMVLTNSKQSLLFDSYYSIGTVNILLPVASILLIYLHFFNQSKVNSDLLFFYFGILFTSTIFFIYPAPAWYVWIIPFLSIFFIQNFNYKNIILYLGFSTFYLVFFIFFYAGEYRDILFLGNSIDLKILNPDFADISFTFLEISLVGIMYAFYTYGIKSNSVYKRKTNLVIGIGGDSGVGKTTLFDKIESIFVEKVLLIEGDGEHKWERGNENWDKFTHLDPKANHIHKQSEAIFSLKNNETIYRSEYNHSNGKFTEPKKVSPKDYIVISGLHPFYLPKLRKNIDLKIYIDTDEKLRRHWKIIRDTKKRGYSTEKILTQIEARLGDAAKYIYPQKDFSDLIIKYFSVNDFDLGNENEQINLGLRIQLDASVHLEYLLDRLDCAYEWDYESDLKSQYIELKSSPTTDFKLIALDLIENIDEIISPEANWDTGYEGLIQLIILQMISEKLK